ncbi:DUF4190 domain-containing protein [Actinomadura sp. WMMB 499]|uniref:DUF4190 domain-containing protein n=1 Tax=Actinomadura sp. WMMB 499 TaxID=1219491 RepID=UPI0012481590|nr:DUF4190 domain-containing protein [Actinomadura sp. WMMB 499]QFG22800.1 DUF4190 domain-containing protein [Actinomadura sp. WMMB 499]
MGRSKSWQEHPPAALSGDPDAMRDYAAVLEQERRFGEAEWWYREAATREARPRSDRHEPVWPPSFILGSPGQWTNYNHAALWAVSFGLLGPITCGLTSLPAIVLGHMAWVRVRRSGQPGIGPAITGTVLGWLMVVVWALVIPQLG